MCGIAGVFTLRRCPQMEDAAAVTRMLEAEVHRGPDDWGLLVPDSLAGACGSWFGSGSESHVRTYRSANAGPGAVLGTRRLAILDLSPRARMPMSTADGRLWITYNGETYNYRELREDLRALGDRFRSYSDTEVILRGWERWGEGVLQRLRSMFAFAVFEAGPVPRLLLARDRFGIKPLYYYCDRERLIFASEVRALLQSGLVPDEPNPEAPVRFLQLGSIPAPQTTVKDVLALPAGRIVVADAAGVTMRSYWELSAYLASSAGDQSQPSRDEAVAATRTELEDAVRRHLVSDVPLGVFLSGGIDSSALVALANRHRDRPLTTLSIIFEELGWSEARFARLVAERYGTDHREVMFRSQDLFDALPQVFAAMDQPTVDGVNMYFVSRAAREAGLTVVLSGTGGDEVFLGYDHFRKVRALEGAQTMLRRLPRLARKRLLGVVEWGASWAGIPALAKLPYLERPTDENTYLLLRGLFAPRQLTRLLGIGEQELATLGPIWAGPRRLEGSRPLLDSLVLLEFEHYLQNQLLKDADVMSMAHSVETRVPYLDHRLIEHVLGLPAALRLDRGRPKALLLDALGEDLPREVWDRPKMGFTFPFEPWLRLRALELEVACFDQKLLQRRAVEAVWREFRAGRLHWSRPWALLVLSRFESVRKQAGACTR